MLKLSRLFLLPSFLLAFLHSAASAQTWQPLANSFPGAQAGQEFLLTDGTILVQNADSPDWWKLTPDMNGSYLNGTWKQMASMNPAYGPLYFASAVLADGKIIVMGGEYNQSNDVVDTNLGAIYDPLADTWTSVKAPSGWQQIGDAASCVLPDGRFMMADFTGTDDVVLNESTLTWSSIGTGKGDSQNEEGWTLLPDGTILTVDGTAQPNTEKYDIATGQWISAGAVPNNLFDTNTLETGPQILRPNKTVFCMGGTQFTAIYTPPANPVDAGTWTAGPNFPVVGGNQLDIADGPGCLLPSGNVLCVASPGVFLSPATVLEFDGTKFIVEPAPPGAPSDSSFQCTLLVLPTGQVMLSDQSRDVEIYTPSGSPSSAWRPTISNCPGVVNQNHSYSISGTQFNGLSQGSAYGDDSQNSTNYPIIRITNKATHHVFYCRTFNHSTMGVATGAATVSTNFTVPLGAENGASTLEVVANGIASAGLTINVGAVVPTVTSYTLSSSSITGSYSVFGVVHISSAASGTGQVVSLSGGDSHVSYPSTVTVPAGSTLKQFTISTTSVSANDVETLRATIGGSFKTATLTVTPSPILSLTFTPSSVIGGQSSGGVVTLYHTAGPSGDVVSLSGGDSSISRPATVTVPAGLTSKSFAIATNPVSANRIESITATLGASSKTTILTISAAVISSFTLSPSSVKGGTNSGGIVHLTGAAGPGGAVVSLSGGDASVHYAASFAIPAGATGGSFLLTTHAVTATKNETITAKLGTSTKMATLTLTP